MTDNPEQPDLLPATTATGSLACSTTGPDLAAIRSLPARLTDEQMALAETVANSALPALQRTDERHLTKCMAALDANMPRRATDGDTAKIRLATWLRMFGEMPRQQVDFMCREALVRHSFFPTIAEFLAIAKDWRRGDEASETQRLAKARVAEEMDKRRSEARQRLRYEEVPQAEIDAMPEWLREALVMDRMLVVDGNGFQQSSHWREYRDFVAAQSTEAA